MCVLFFNLFLLFVCLFEGVESASLYLCMCVCVKTKKKNNVRA